MTNVACPLCGTLCDIANAQPGATVRCSLCANTFPVAAVHSKQDKHADSHSELSRAASPILSNRAQVTAKRRGLLTWLSAPFVSIYLALAGFLDWRGTPTNGAALMQEGAQGGHGELEAVNGTPNDACVLVIDDYSQKRVRFFYVRAGNTSKVLQIVPGEYSVLFATGAEWDKRKLRFTRDAEYFKFETPLRYEETYQNTAFRYSIQTVTLNAVPGGNARTRQISEAEFAAAQKSQ
jgi:hypothetical protein